MKNSKFIAAFINLVMIFMLCACGSNDTQNNSSETEIEDVATIEDATYGDIAQKMNNFTIYGKEISLPCTLGEFRKQFDLEKGFPMSEDDAPSTSYFSFLNDGKVAGGILVYCENGTENINEECMIYALSIDESIDNSISFEISNVNEKMSMSQIEDVWGTADYVNVFREIIYCDNDYDPDSWQMDYICFSFVDETEKKIERISFTINIDRVKKGSEELDITNTEADDGLTEKFTYEKTGSITIPRNIVVKDGETIDITLTPLIYDPNSVDEEVEFAKEELDTTDAYKNEDNSITLVLSGDQLESLIKLYEITIAQRIHGLLYSDIFIDKDLDKISYYISSDCDYFSFQCNRLSIETLILISQSLSGSNYTDCYLVEQVIDAETGDLLFEHYTDADGLHNVPTNEEWNEKLGITNEENANGEN